MNSLSGVTARGSLVVRTDFTDDRGWSAVVAEIRATTDAANTAVQYIDNRIYDGLTLTQLIEIELENAELTYVFLVDSTTIADPEHLVLVVDLADHAGWTFRVTPSQLSNIADSLSTATRSFFEFADSVDEDGVFRGFSEAI
jgi:hypothetical protein